MRRICVFGSTGSIGQNTVDLLVRQGRDTPYEVVALTGGRNVALLAEQARALKAQFAVTAFPEMYDALKAALAGSGIAVGAGETALREAAERPADWTMSAIVGAAGLEPGLISLAHGGTLALANKESLVTAGALLLAQAKHSGATVLPVDSEHSAVFQALVGEDISSVERIIITASGGPFRGWSAARIAAASVEQAMAHPNWSMGQRISIDSASLFNKAMEVIETKEYFGVLPEQVEVLVHPQSIVHALVGFCDGAMMAHLGPADMRHAIGYALNWPRRGPNPVARLDLAALAQLTFEAPDEARFPALRLARAVMAGGGLHGAVFNAAKEATLDAFLVGRIGFSDMARIVEDVMEDMAARENLTPTRLSLDNVRQMDHLARVRTDEAIGLRHAS